MTEEQIYDFDFEYVSYYDIFPRSIPEGDYTLEVVSLEPEMYTAASGKQFPILNGIFRVEYDHLYWDHRLYQKFFASFQRDHQLDLKYLMLATGVRQEREVNLGDWARGFGKLNPPALFQAHVDCIGADEWGMGGRNLIKFNTAEAAARREWKRKRFE